MKQRLALCLFTIFLSIATANACDYTKFPKGFPKANELKRIDGKIEEQNLVITYSLFYKNTNARYIVCYRTASRYVDPESNITHLRDQREKLQRTVIRNGSIPENVIYELTPVRDLRKAGVGRRFAWREITKGGEAYAAQERLVMKILDDHNSSIEKLKAKNKREH